MVENAYEVVDLIEKSEFKKILIEVKRKINKEKDVKKLIKNFEEVKELYEKFNVKEDFMKAKNDLLSNELLKEYINLQEQINLLTLKINNRIKKVTKGVTNK